MSSELILYVREVADELVADLERAGGQTRGFADRRKAVRAVASAMEKCLDSLRATGLVGRDNQVPSAALWEVAGDLLEHGDLQQRARFKPRGYAGDDRLLLDIYEQRLCDHPLGHCFDVYFQKQDAPQAVRSRIDLAGRQIAEHLSASDRPDYRLACVGAGPAMEVKLALEQAADPSRVSVTLLDLDPEALEAAEARLRPLLAADRLHAMRENLFRLPRVAEKSALLAEVDFIVCLGLFDYLEDADAAAMVELFWRSLRPGGRLLVGNFAPGCQARAYMEWIGNWYLIYRTREQLAALAQSAGLPAEGCNITAEPQEANLLLEVQKPA